MIELKYLKHSSESEKEKENTKKKGVKIMFGTQGKLMSLQQVWTTFSSPFYHFYKKQIEIFFILIIRNKVLFLTILIV